MKKFCLALIVAAGCGGRSSTPATAPAAPEPDEKPVAAEPPQEHPHEQPPPEEPAAPDPEKVKADLLAAETAAYERARPVFETYCAGCHTKGGKNASKKKLEHFDMTAYPFGGHHAGEMGTTVRKVLGIDGSKPTMPRGKPGAVQGDELAAIAAWADAFDAAHKGGAHEAHQGHGGHHH
jgi:mono/diheme cytochrome c family protein